MSAFERWDWNEGRFFSIILYKSVSSGLWCWYAKPPGDFESELNCADFPALKHLAKLTRLRMYNGDQVCCARWIISSVKSCFNYAEIPYDASIFSFCRLRGLNGGASDNYGF